MMKRREALKNGAVLMGGAVFGMRNAHAAISSVAGNGLTHGGALKSSRLPDGVTELVGLDIYSLIGLKDGTILANNGRVSKDGGRSWSSPRRLIEGFKSADLAGTVGTGLVRLKSGAIIFTADNQMWTSKDEGSTWSGPIHIFPKMIGGPYYLGDQLIQLKSGRLLYPAYVSYSGESPVRHYKNSVTQGIWRGQAYGTEGESHIPMVYVTMISYSDDDGKSWNMVKGIDFSDQPLALMGWFNELGVPDRSAQLTGFGEATLAETNDGRVLMFGRPTVNRVLYTYSRDAGKTWEDVLPTVLADSISPPRLRRIPKTGDLICVWNQVSRAEVQRGYRRGRLSVAISKDSGASWQNFKTLEQSEGLEDVVQITPEYPISMVLSRQDVGQLPNAWMYFHYANVSFAGDKVYIMYPRGGPLLGIAEENLDKQENVLRIYPIEWFYS